MDIDLSRRYFEGYRQDAENARQDFLNGQQGKEFCARALELIRTYLESSPFKGDLSDADEAILWLALTIHQQAVFYGFWNEVTVLGPRLRQVAEESAKPLLFAEATKLSANLLSRRGDSAEAAMLFVNLMAHPLFPTLPLYLQTDILITAGTDAVWNGQLANGEQLLLRGSQLASQCATIEPQPIPLELAGIRPSGTFMPWWENKAYALNQLGTLALFRADFAQAHRHLEACQSLLVAHGHADNLARVAYQGLGRVLFHEGRYIEAKANWQRGLVLRQRFNEEEGFAVNSLYLAACELSLHNLPEAERLLEGARSIFQRLGVRLELGICHLYLGDVQRQRCNSKGTSAQWRIALHWLGTVSTPFIELRPLIRALGWLVLQQEWRLIGSILKQANHSLKEQQLSWSEVLRLL